LSTEGGFSDDGNPTAWTTEAPTPISTCARTDGEAAVSTGVALLTLGLEDPVTFTITRATTTTTTTPTETKASVVDENLRGAAA
jgi:hypothetical protein